MVDRPGRLPRYWIRRGRLVWLLFEYQPKPKFRVIGFPVPAVCFVLEKHGDEEEHWVDYVSPAPLLFAASNVFLFSFVSVYPVWLVNTLWRTSRWASRKVVQP